MTIKRLGLESWMIHDHKDPNPQLGTGRYRELSQGYPVIGSNGYYYDRGFCWIEVNGKAYFGNPVDWKYRFDLITASELNARQADALFSIVEAKLASKEQKKLLQRRVESEVARQVRRDMKILVMRWRKSKS